MRESRTYGSVRGAGRNLRPYRDRAGRRDRSADLGYTGRGTKAVGKKARNPVRNKLECGVSAIHTPATCPRPALLLLGIIGCRRSGLVQESFLIFLVVAPKKEGKNDRRNERRPSKWSSDSTNAFAKYETANSEHGRPDNSPSSVEDEKPQRAQSVCASQQCRKGAE